MKPQLIWNLPIRLFHWSLAVLVSVSLYTGIDGDIDLMDYHVLSGYGILGLIIFRLLFGIAGRGNVNFLSFVKGPKTVLAYLRNRNSASAHGHNPLGGWSVTAMLLLLSAQVGTGLFATDDVFLEGPLYHLVSYDTSMTLTGLHELNQWLLIGFIALHIGAVMFHEWRLKERLILPMITGKKLLGGEVELPGHQWLVALACGGLAALLTWLIVTRL